MRQKWNNNKKKLEKNKKNKLILIEFSNLVSILDRRKSIKKLKNI